MKSVVTWGQDQFKNKKHIVIGYSLGGAMALNALVQFQDFKPDLTVTVNAPIDLFSSAQKLCFGEGRLYGKNFVLELKKEVEFKQKTQNVYPMEPILLTDHLMDFDEKFTAPLSGFKNAQDYYEKCSVQNRLDQIQSPAVLLTSQDDPIVEFASYQNLKTSEHVDCRVIPVGGHLGYVYQRQGLYLSYLEDVISEIVRSR